MNILRVPRRFSSSCSIFTPTPASEATIEGIRALADRRPNFWKDKIGLDWGTGTGILARETLSLGAKSCIGLDISLANIRHASAKAAKAPASFFVADGFTPHCEAGSEAIAEVRESRGGFDFIVANPPASSGDDGFGFRRRILADAVEIGLLRKGGHILMQWLSYYGTRNDDPIDSRGARAARAAEGLLYEEVVHETSWQPLWDDNSASRAILMPQLMQYANAEGRGEQRFYCHPAEDGRLLTARETVEWMTAVDGELRVPKCRWSINLFNYS
ncbi:hypothetical protein TrST_g11404 [Triparma strigata]|uniref:Methyltransferase domain-containing protein n=1 Tax=Triparma strigata TaxID=1606541 RepID=A0A9W7EFE9_9STRA|nr:hypothetical protein TrST_g11404 [Triparma strigata]